MASQWVRMWAEEAGRVCVLGSLQPHLSTVHKAREHRIPLENVNDIKQKVDSEQ